MSTVEAYVIVHTETRRIEIDSRSSDGRWTTTTYEDFEAYLRVAAFTLDEIYGRPGSTE